MAKRKTTKAEPTEEVKALRRRVAELEKRRDAGAVSPAGASDDVRRLDVRMKSVRLLNAISEALVDQPTVEIDAGIERAFAILCESVDADRGFVLFIHEDGTRIDGAHEWCAPGVEPLVSALRNIDAGDYEWGFQQIRGGRHMAANRVADLPDEAASFRDALLREGIRSVLAVPIIRESGLVGLVGFQGVLNEKQWLDEDAVLLTPIAALFGSALERRRAENALRESEARYRLLADNVRDTIWTTDMDLNYTYVSPSVRELSGFAPEEVIGTNLLDHVAKEEKAFARELIEVERAALAAGRMPGPTTRTVEIRRAHKDGSSHWVEANVSWLRDEDGRAIGVLGVTRDITLRKRAERTLRNSETRHRAMLSALPDLMFRFSRDGRFREFHAPDPSTLWLHPDLFMGKDLRDVLPPAVAERFANQIDEGFRTRRMQVFEYELPVDKKVRSYEARLVVSDLGDVVVFVRDITEVKTAVTALRESESKYRNLVETASDGICIIQNGAVAYANEQLCRFMNEPADRLVGRPFLDYIHPGHRKILHNLYVRHMSGERDLGIVEVRVGPPPNHDIEVEINTSVITYGGTPAELVVVRDVTERNRSQRERTMLEEQLRQVQKLEAIGRLAGGVAHDFNNMLMGVRGGASVLIHRLEAGSPERRTAETIGRAATHMTDLTEQLLTFAQGGSPEPAACDLNAIVEDSLRLLPTSIRKRLVVESDPGERIPPVEVDRTQITQVAMNLFQNAFEAMNGRGRLLIATRLVDPSEVPSALEDGERRFALLTVDDTGPGVAPEARERVFDPFFTTKEYGRGLGLSAVYGIVQNHKGLITCGDAPTGGARFSVYLPISRRPEAEADRRRAGAVEAEASGATILVVDDDPISRDMTAAMLEMLGHRVQTAASGEEAIAATRRNGHRFDAVLLDVVMPDLDGVETFRRLYKIQPDLPVLFFSGFNDRVILDEEVKELAHGFLKKPIDIKKLAEAISGCRKGDRAAK